LQCKKWIKRVSNERDKIAQIQAASVTVDTPDDSRIQDMLEAIKSLSERERLAVHLFYSQSMSVEHARKVLGLSVSGYYRMLDRTRRKLERLLERQRGEYI
jgi:DNA-directed RNA polymerase specialized sigma subunit